MTQPKFLLIAALLVAPLAAHAADPVTPSANLQAAFGNTLLTIDPDGRYRTLWMQPDGTWTGVSRREFELAGTWKVNGDKVCLAQSKPLLLESLCLNFPADLEAGAEVKDPLGKTVQIKLVAGHVAPEPVAHLLR